MSQKPEVLLRQFELWDQDTGSRLITWLENDGRLVKGAKLTIKGMEPVVWTVEEVYNTVRPASEFRFYRGWNNNI